MAKVQHFEIPADDLDRAKQFYARVFDWVIEPFDEDNLMVAPGGEKGEVGVIGGDIHLRGATVSHPTFVVTVDDIEETLSLIEAAGGSRLGEIQPLGETARYAYFEDCEGNRLGVYDDRAG